MGLSRTELYAGVVGLSWVQLPVNSRPTCSPFVSTSEAFQTSCSHHQHHIGTSTGDASGNTNRQVQTHASGRDAAELTTSKVRASDAAQVEAIASAASSSSTIDAAQQHSSLPDASSMQLRPRWSLHLRLQPFKVNTALLMAVLCLAHLSLLPIAAARPEPALRGASTTVDRRQLALPLQPSSPSTSGLQEISGVKSQKVFVDSTNGPQQLAACLNHGYVPRNMSWEQAVNDHLAALKAERIWWSNAPEPSNPVTLVTQLSADRLPQLAAQCASWGGRLSAAVHLMVPASPEADDMPKAQTPPPGPASNWLVDQLGGAHKAKIQQELSSKGKNEGTLMTQLVLSIQQMVKTGRGPSRRRAAEVEMWAGGKAAEKLVANAVQAIAELHAQTEERIAELAAEAADARGPLRGTGCALDVTLVVEEVSSLAQAHMHYPVNALRNVARLQARTPLVALMDVDMLVSSKLVHWLERPDHAANMIQECAKGTAYVLPAFETYGPNILAAAETAEHLITTNKQALARAVVDGLAGPFDAHRFSHGHAPTNFKAWFMTNEAYDIDYEFRFEPWVIVHRMLAPWYDARFRGYGFNKIEHVAHLNATGFKFVVHPTGFIIHRAHEVARARTQFLADLKTLHKSQEQKLQLREQGRAASAQWQNLPKWKQQQQQAAWRRRHQQALAARQQSGGGMTDTNSTLYGHMKILMDTVHQLLDQASFVPVVDPGTARCAWTLPWWNGGAETTGSAAAGAAAPTTGGARSSSTAAQLEAGAAALVQNGGAVLSSVAHTVMDLGAKAGAHLVQHAAAGSDWEAGATGRPGEETVQHIGEYTWGIAQGQPLQPLSGLRVGS